MPRLKKITLDATNCTVIESVDVPRIARKPIFYANETVAIDVNTVEMSVTTDGFSQYSAVKPAGTNSVAVRLGTATTLVAQGTDFTWVPPVTQRATLAVTTAAAVSIPLELVVESVPSEPPVFNIRNFKPAISSVVTVFGSLPASFSVAMESQSLAAASITVPAQEASVLTTPGFEIFVGGSSLTFSTLVNTPVTATFTVSTVGGAVSAISISNAGSGYPDGTYSLTITGGTVTTAATAQAVASGGSVVSVSITEAGSGYVTKPAASLFRPAKSVVQVMPSRLLGLVNNRQRFYWHNPLPNLTSVTVLFADVESTGTPPTHSKPVAKLDYVTTDSTGLPVWEVNLVSGGYGYTSAPAVSASAFQVSSRKRTTSASVNGDSVDVSVSYDNNASILAEDGCFIPTMDPYHAALAYNDTIDGVAGTYSIPAGFELRSGSYLIEQLPNTSVGTAPCIISPRERGRLGRGYIQTWSKQFSTSEITEQQFLNLAGRSFICAVIPDSESLGTLGASGALEQPPERYALVRISFPTYPSGLPSYYVGQSYTLERDVSQNRYFDQTYKVGLIPNAPNPVKYAPGGGFWEPTIEFLDYGKGYKSASALNSQVGRWGYKLRVLSGLQINYVIDASPVTRSVTATTVGNGDLGSLLPTSLSSEATIATRSDGSIISTFVNDGGFGYLQSANFSVSAATGPGRIRSVQVSNRPYGYLPGEYDCTVSGGGGTGAQVRLVVEPVPDYLRNSTLVGFLDPTRFYARVVCAGTGYTSAPTIIAPSPTSSQPVATKIMTGGNIVNDFEDVYISSKPPAVIGYEAVPCIFSWYNNDSPIRTGVIKGPARAYGVVCNGVYYKIPDSAIGTKTISKEGTSIKISILFSKDPKYQVPDGFVIVDENFDHYISDDVAKYPLIFSPSPQINGTAEGFVIFLRSSYPDGKDWDYRVFITKTGYGYVTKPSITIQPPPVSGYYIKSLKIASGWGSSLPKFPGNPFEGFEDVRVYPFSGIPINIQRDQYGVPQIRDENPFFCVITPGPFVGEESAAIACYDLDFSYARKYQFNHAAQLANNVPAAIEREKIWKEWEGTKVFFVRRGRTIRYMDSGVTYTALGGPGKIPAIYSSIPTVSAPTYSGFVITSVTIVCQGYYYDSDAQILDQDPTGSGAIITIDEVKRGKIKKITLKEGGAGYSATPSIGFTEPGYNPSDVPSIEGIKQTLVISAASAGAVLGSQDSVDASLEIYEIEGSAENVLAQVPVKLAKRVSYS